MAQPDMKVTAGTYVAFSSGGAGYGIVYNAHYFVLFYYSQVMGLEAGLAGLAVSIGLIFDAISLDYHHTLQAASGHGAEAAREAAMEEERGVGSRLWEDPLRGLCLERGE